jgi:hypothetical protein
MTEDQYLGLMRRVDELFRRLDLLEQMGIVTVFLLVVVVILAWGMWRAALRR